MSIQELMNRTLFTTHIIRHRDLVEQALARPPCQHPRVLLCLHRLPQARQRQHVRASALVSAIIRLLLVLIRDTASQRSASAKCSGKHLFESVCIETIKCVVTRSSVAAGC